MSSSPDSISRRRFLLQAGAWCTLPLLPGLRAAEPAPRAQPDFDRLSLEQQVGQMVIARLADWPLMERYAREGLISGLTPYLVGRPPEEVAEFTNRFQRLSPLPLLFGWSGVCYSGGTDLRLGQAMRLGATRSAELCAEAARIEAVESRALGFHLANVPNLDVNINPDNPIINLRSLGDDVALVTELGSALARGTIAGGGASNLMHFPGHGASQGDSHIRMPEVARSLAELEAVELRPFAAVIRHNLARVICTNHCDYPALEPGRIPATMSRPIITGLLRHRLGYRGVIMSDSLTMRPIKDRYGIEEAAIGTVEAGHDLILQDYNSDPRITIDALARAVRQGRIPLEQVRASVGRVWQLKTDLGLFQQREVDPARLPEVFATKASAEVARRIARESVTLLEASGWPWPAGGDRKVVVISNGSVEAVDQDRQVLHSPANQRFHEQVRARVGPRPQEFILSTKMTPAEMSAALAAAREADVVVVGLFTRVRAYAEDAISLAPPFAELIAEIAKAGRTMALANFGNPYVIAHLPRADITLCAFSDANDSIDATVGVLFGELPPKGRLPVKISAAYPYGHGRT